ncbi:R-spondin-1 isoform X2 [Entelurus aequoreus]|uniref:R-spondin-1 isoform X2 n=1 Tax=Entelurus aequoreus TaxID=161455 RepID=UPI002B1DAB33|nr:R-spondin-1 isoform X2 [Entelurus aequoreus]
MQLGVVVLAMLFLSSMGHADVVKPSKARRHRRDSGEGLPSCSKGCERCSEVNGCLKCRPKLFIYFQRNNISEVAICLASCPMGYFGMRNPGGNNRCYQCELAEWSQWGSCTKKNKTCGFKKGTQSRVRLPGQHPRKSSTPSAGGPSQRCAAQTERRKCTVAKIPCVRDKKNSPGGDVKKGSRGGRVRKGQSRTTVIPNITSSSVT